MLIRFLWKGERILAVAIADDGNGMSPEQLLNAMRFGSAERGDHMLSRKVRPRAEARFVQSRSKTHGRLACWRGLFGAALDPGRHPSQLGLRDAVIGSGG